MKLITNRRNHYQMISRFAPNQVFIRGQTHKLTLVLDSVRDCQHLNPYQRVEPELLKLSTWVMKTRGSLQMRLRSRTHYMQENSVDYVARPPYFGFWTVWHDLRTQSCLMWPLPIIQLASNYDYGLGKLRLKSFYLFWILKYGLLIE